MKPALIFIASCFLVVTATAQQRKATGVIYGRVVLQNGGAGKRIWLMAEPLDSGDQWPGTRSDDRGEYRFKSLPWGRYAVHAEDSCCRCTRPKRVILARSSTGAIGLSASRRNQQRCLHREGR